MVIERTTGAYHGYMAAILFVGYLLVIIYNLFQKKKECRVNIPWILAIGILVQLGWESGLLLGRREQSVSFTERIVENNRESILKCRLL